MTRTFIFATLLLGLMFCMKVQATDVTVSAGIGTTTTYPQSAIATRIEVGKPADCIRQGEDLDAVKAAALSNTNKLVSWFYGLEPTFILDTANYRHIEYAKLIVDGVPYQAELKIGNRKAEKRDKNAGQYVLQFDALPEYERIESKKKGQEPQMKLRRPVLGPGSHSIKWQVKAKDVNEELNIPVVSWIFEISKNSDRTNEALIQVMVTIPPPCWQELNIRQIFPYLRGFERPYATIDPSVIVEENMVAALGQAQVPTMQNHQAPKNETELPPAIVPVRPDTTMNFVDPPKESVKPEKERQRTKMIAVYGENDQNTLYVWVEREAIYEGAVLSFVRNGAEIAQGLVTRIEKDCFYIAMFEGGLAVAGNEKIVLKEVR